jgi:PAS domain S-box-containing protein
MPTHDRDAGIRSFLRWFFIEQPRWHLLRFVLPLLVALISAVWWSSDVSNAQEVSLQTLTARVEQTRQEYKGLEAFLLSDVDGIVGNLSDARVTPEFEKEFIEFQDAVASAIAREPAQVSIKVETDPRGQGQSLRNKYITDSEDKPTPGQAQEKQGFLFFPAMVLAADIPSDERVEDKTIITAATREGRQLRAQLFAAQDIDSKLARFVQIETFNSGGLGVGPKPVQCYYLTSTGIIRLYSTNLQPGEEQVSYYKHQFKPTTFFPDRPYFWPTIKQYTRDLGGTDHTVKTVFHQTRPYLDLGGNGVVVTLSIGIKAKGLNSGLFLDFTLGDTAKERIKEKIRKVGGFAAETSWVLPDDGDPYRKENGDALSNKREDVCKTEFKLARTLKADQSLSDLFGDIYVFQRGLPGTITFTVPLGRPNTGQSAGAITFLYCELSPTAFRFWASLKLLACGLSMATFVGFIVLALRDYELKFRQHKEFLEKVTQLMSDAPVAYCRLNQEEKFVEMNDSFAMMLGYESKEQAERELICEKKWQDLLDAASRGKYERDIKPRRANREPTGPYPVKMRRPNGERWVEVTVHGADVPGGKGFPETFGLLLRKGPVLVLESEEMVVRPFYNPPRKSVPPVPPELFVLMPFDEEIAHVFEKHIRSVAQKLSLALTRADRILDEEFVMVKTWEAICRADVIVVDCSALKPNVLYELGLAHVVNGKKVVLIGQLEPEKLPFNIQGMEYIRYALDRMERFEQRLEEKLRVVLGHHKTEA